MTPRRRALLTLLKTADISVVALCFVLAVGIAIASSTPVPLVEALTLRVELVNVLFVLTYLGSWHFVLRGVGLYSSYRLSSATRELRDLLTGVLIAVGSFVPFAALFRFEYATPVFLCVFGGLTFFTLAVERRVLRLVARRLRTVGRNLRDVVIIGDGDNALQMSAQLASRQDFGYRVVRVMEVGESQSSEQQCELHDSILRDLIDSIETHCIDEVFITVPIGDAYRLVQAVVNVCEEQGIVVRVVARVADLDWARAIVDEMAGAPVLTIFSGPPETVSLIVKRGIDIIGAVVGLVCLAPVLLIVAVIIKLDSRGPVLFVQERVGCGRHRFATYKFRTMVQGAEALQAGLESRNEAQGPIFKMHSDPRVTRVGAWLRRTSIDELPQLFNVLLGTMSLVGPRPLPVRDVERIDVKWHRRRFSVKPGLTGMWQVYGRAPDFDEWIKADMRYIDQWSLALDMKILLKTIPTVISGVGVH